MSKMKLNFSKEINGQTYNFKNITVGTSRYGLFVPMMGVSQVIRQYIKQKWNGLKFQISSSTFSMGDSVDIFLPCVSQQLYDEVNHELTKLFQGGRFNGMYDVYECKEKEFVIEHNGQTAGVYTKYLHVNNRPKYGTKIYNEMKQAGLLEW